MSDAGQPPPGPPPGQPPAPPSPPIGAPPPPPPAGYAPAPPTAEWRSLRGLTTALTIFLWLAAVAAVFEVFAFVNRIGFESDLLDNGLLGVDDVIDRRDTADGLVGGSVALMGVISLVIFVLILIWTFRAMKNNEALGRRQRFTPGWGIGAWFIPLANLIIVQMIFWDLWKGSDPSVPVGQGAQEASGSALVILWAVTHFLAGFRFGGLGGEAHLDRPDELEDLRTSDTVAVGGAAAAIIAAILAVFMLRGIARRQEECAAQRGGAPV